MTPHLFIQDPGGTYRRATSQEVLASARKTAGRLFRPGSTLSRPGKVVEFLRAKLAGNEREVFCCLFLDQKHRFLAFERLFFGTVSEAMVYPREVVKAALRLNSAAVILAHNHPSGDPSPSAADRVITDRLKVALDLVGVRLLDHIVISATDHRSMADFGQI